jgi:adenosylcobinamide-GDP ribazoletransferase
VRSALAFLTPLGGAVAPSPEAFSWFPVVGLVLGLALGALWWGAARLWPADVAAGIVVAGDLGLTGLLHVDGLADAADGLLAPMSRQRRLDAMSEPGVGAFGVAAVVAVLLLRWAALAALRPSVLLLAAVWCASRTWMAATATAVPYARGDGGLATAFLGPRSWLPDAAGLVAALALALVGRGAGGAVGVAAGSATAAAVVALAWRRVGGFTGDVLGAAGVMGETVALVVAAARW